MIMKLEQQILLDLKISLSKVQCSHIANFINILGHFQFETLVRLIKICFI
jgi:hypothetical protein